MHKNHERSQVTLEVLMISSARKTNTKLWCSVLNTPSMSWTAQQHIRIQVMEGLWSNRSCQFPPLPWRKTPKKKTTTAILQVRPICQTQSTPNGTAFQFQFQPRNEDFLKQMHQAPRFARSKKDAESMTSSLRSWATPKFLDSNHTRVPRNKHSTLINLAKPIISHEVSLNSLPVAWIANAELIQCFSKVSARVLGMQPNSPHMLQLSPYIPCPVSSCVPLASP